MKIKGIFFFFLKRKIKHKDTWVNLVQRYYSNRSPAMAPKMLVGIF
jgi:hypothetical protein